MLKRLKNIFGGTSSDDTVASKNKKEKSLKLRKLYKEETPFNEWKLIKELGDGAFSKVYHAYNEQKKHHAAAKVINDCTDDELEDHLVEVDILTACKHENIIQLYDTYLFEKKLFIFLEYCPYGAIDHIITTLEHGLNEKQICFIGYETLEALDYLHTKQFVIHRDVKASNILLTQTGQVKIADFGVSIKNDFQEQRQNDYIGTVYWMAPEVFFCEATTDNSYDYRVDIWSFGITLIEMAEMDPPHHDVREDRVGMKIRQGSPPQLKHAENWSKEFSNFLSCCLRRDPKERKTCQELKQHTFMSNAKTFHSTILYLIEEYKATPVVEVIDDDNLVPESQSIDESKNDVIPSKNSTSNDNTEKNSLSHSNSTTNDDEDISDHLANSSKAGPLTKFDETEPSITLKQIRRLSSVENIRTTSSLDKEDDGSISEISNNLPSRRSSFSPITSSMTIPLISRMSPTLDSLTTTSVLNKIPSYSSEQMEHKNSYLPTITSRISPTPIILDEELSSTDEKTKISYLTQKVAKHIEVNRLEMQHINNKELDMICELHYQELLEEVIQSDSETPSIPDVILSVITDLTSDDNETNINYKNDLQYENENNHIQAFPYYFKRDKSRSSSPFDVNRHENIDNYYTHVYRSFKNSDDPNSLNRGHHFDQRNSFDKTQNYLENRAARRRTIRTTRRFVGPDGREQEIVITKIVEPYNDYQLKLNERKEAHREFRRLYHLEEKRRQQLLNRHEFEIDEQREEFRRKREDLMKKYEFELETMDQKQTIEIQRENALFNTEYKKKYKQIRLEQDRELKQFREHHKYDYDSTTSTYHNQTHLLEQAFLNNQQEILEQQLKAIENSHKQRRKGLEKQYYLKKENLLKLKDEELKQIDEQELRSRYDLLRKQTKSFYSLFYTMLLQQSDKELQQFNEHVRFERETLETHFIEDRKEMKKLQKIRYKQFRQKLNSKKLTLDDEKHLIRKFENDENERYRIQEEDLKERHRQLREDLLAKQQAARNELLGIQRQKLEQCTEFETRKLQELKMTFENDWNEFRNAKRTHKLHSIVSLPYSSATLFRTRFSPFATTVVRPPEASSRPPVILRSTGSHRLQSWHSWPGVDLNNDEQFWTLSNANENILF